MSTSALDPQTASSVYLVDQDEHKAVLALPATEYQLHLTIESPLKPTPQRRVKGVIRCPVWKVDTVSAGGAYIEPVLGRPRRIQGRVVGSIDQSNTVILEVRSTLILGDLPDRWTASELPVGSPLAIDVRDGSSFRPA